MAPNNDASEQIAAEAARLMAEERYTEHEPAKQKAAARLGLSRGARLPDNAAVDRALAAYWAEFGDGEHAELIAAMRAAAQEAMAHFAALSPKLVGPVASGLAHADDAIVLLGYSDDEKALAITLINQNIDYDTREITLMVNGRRQTVSAYDFEWDGWAIRLITLADRDRRANVKWADGRTA